VHVRGVVGPRLWLLSRVLQHITESLAFRRRPNAGTRVWHGGDRISSLRVNTDCLVVAWARDIMHLGEVLRLSDIFNSGLEREFESVSANREIVVGVGAGAGLALAVLVGALAGDKLLSVIVARRLVLEVSGHVVLLNRGTLAVEAGLDGVAGGGRRRQSVSGALKAVAHAEGRRPVQLHGRAERDRKVSGDHGLELAEAAALSKGELVLG